MRVAILGASNRSERYSHQALLRLAAAGHEVYPIHPRLEKIAGHQVLHSLIELPQPVDTLTVYVNKQRSNELLDQILRVRPRRIILNPGAENPALESEAKTEGIVVERACTLVLLATGQF